MAFIKEYLHDQINMTERLLLLTAPAYYLRLKFVVVMVWSNSTLRFVIVKNIVYFKYIFWSCLMVNVRHCQYFRSCSNINVHRCEHFLVIF